MASRDILTNGSQLMQRVELLTILHKASWPKTTWLLLQRSKTLDEPTRSCQHGDRRKIFVIWWLQVAIMLGLLMRPERWYGLQNASGTLKIEDT
jgi:hypothetical protein